MILAILEDLSKTETLLNNLSEADFNLEDVSILSADIQKRDAVAKDVGPLRGITPKKLADALAKLGVPGPTAKLCQDALLKGKVLAAMNITAELSKAAQEMFTDQSAQIIQGNES